MELPVYSLGSFYEGVMGLLLCIEASEISFFAVLHDVAKPSPAAGSTGNAISSLEPIGSDDPVCGLLRSRCLAEIRPAIVEPIAILMIDFRIGPSAHHVEKYQFVRVVLLVNAGLRTDADNTIIGFSSVWPTTLGDCASGPIQSAFWPRLEPPKIRALDRIISEVLKQKFVGQPQFRR